MRYSNKLRELDEGPDTNAEEARLQLISAAPEMAEALLLALDHIGDPCRVCDLELTGIIRASLQKAGLL